MSDIRKLTVRVLAMLGCAIIVLVAGALPLIFAQRQYDANLYSG